MHELEPFDKIPPVAVVRAVGVRVEPELVQHRLGPARARNVVAQNTYVAGAVDVDAERVLHLAIARNEIAPVERRSYIEAHAVERTRRQGCDIVLLEIRIEVDPDRFG